MFTNKEPIDEFKEGCKKINIAEHLITAFCEELETVPSNMTYEKLSYPFSLAQLRDFVSEVQEYVCDEQVYSSFNRALNEAPSIQDRAKNIDPTTHAAAVLTLIEIMAGCSKLGMGSEDTSGKIPNSCELAEKLFNDEAFAEIVYSLWQRCRNEKNYHDYMVPFMFASAVLVPKNENTNNDTNDKRSKLRKILPNTIMAYEDIQIAYFGNCLTQAAIQAKETYYEFFFESTGANDNFDMFSKTFSDEKIVELILSVRSSIGTEIKERIETGPDQHRLLAKRWYTSPPWKMATRQSANFLNTALPAVETELPSLK